MNIAFKWHYNDHNYKGVCSQSIRSYNIYNRKADWCSKINLKAKINCNNPTQVWEWVQVRAKEGMEWMQDWVEEVKKGNFQWDEVPPCYEAGIFRLFRVYAGMDTQAVCPACNKKIITSNYCAKCEMEFEKALIKSKPRRITRELELKGNIALHTTRLPGESEPDRRIFGFFAIKDVEVWIPSSQEHRGRATTIHANRVESLYIHPEIWQRSKKAPKLWQYFRGEKKVEEMKWGTGLFRYIPNEWEEGNPVRDALGNYGGVRKFLEDLRDSYVELGANNKEIKVIETHLNRILSK